MDLLKVYDCISHELLIAKLHCHGVNNTSLRLMLDYLTNRKQKTKIGSSFISWHDIHTSLPQGSILGHLLFNIFVNDLFFSITKSEVCTFADDNTLYNSKKDPDLYHDINNVLEIGLILILLKLILISIYGSRSKQKQKLQHKC